MEQVAMNKKKRTDKISLSESSTVKIDHWLSQLSKWQTVVHFSKSDLVDFLIAHHSELLSPNEEREFLKCLVSRDKVPKIRKPRQKRTQKNALNAPI